MLEHILELEVEKAPVEIRFEGQGTIRPGLGSFFVHSIPIPIKLAEVSKIRLLWPSGTVFFEGKVTSKGSVHGQGCLFNEAGVLWFEGQFKYGVMEGPGREFYPDGQVLFEGEYKDGRRHGRGKEFHPTGRLRYFGHFANGVYQGEGMLYYPDGRIKYQGSFYDGLFDGEGVLFDEAGNIVFEGYFCHGEPIKDDPKGNEERACGEAFKSIFRF